MNEERKHFWRKPRPSLTRVFVWFVLLTGAVSLAICCFVPLLVEDTRFLEKIEPGLVVSILAAVLVFGFLFIRWLCCWRNFVRFLFGLTCVVTLIGLAYVEENMRGKWAWERFKREWEAKGERFDRASVVPPPVPEDQNFALTPVVASSYNSTLDKHGNELRPRNTNVVDRLEMSTTYKSDQPTNGIGSWQKSRPSDLKAWQQYYRALAAKTNLFPVPAQPQTPAADVLLALSKYDAAIEELRAASQLPYSRFPLCYDHESPAAMLLPHFAVVKRCTLVLELRTLAELQSSQSAKALDDVKLLLRLAHSIETEPTLISHLVRIALVSITVQPIWEGLAEQRWSDAQLVELDRELARLDFLSAYQLALRGEMVLLQGGECERLRRHPEALSEFSTINPEESGQGLAFFPLDIFGRFIPSGWIYQNQLGCARVMVQCFLPAADVRRGTISPTFVRDAEAQIKAKSKYSPYHVLERLLMPALVPCANKFAAGQSFVNLARVACALERYRLAHGEYPASLVMLSPQFIAKLPHDVIGGQPLKYRRTDDGQFVLYSVGWNETDDGGEVVPRKGSSFSVDTAKGDWVWRYPEK